MSEERLSSNKLDIEGAQRLSAGEEKFKESYKPISEDINLSHVTGETVKNSNMVRENGDFVQDGADEKMLGTDDKESLALKSVEVKFISGDPNQNGDAKIDIGSVEKTFTGMTKEELMKYANDPFWVKLRWVLFIFFWALWIAMLLGAIAIIIYAPKCAAPTPLVWWKKGPLITIDGTEDADKIEQLKEFNAKGVVYELSPDETYFVDTEPVKSRILKMVKDFGDIHLVLDLTANYVTKDDQLFKDATAEVIADPEVLSAFVTSNSPRPNNWIKVDRQEPAWKQEGKKFFLSQFGNHYDLQMSSPVVQQKLIDVLNKLTEMGVKGFRLANAKHFIINAALKDERPNEKPEFGKDDYQFYTHEQTTYQDGLGKLLHNLSRAVHNATEGEGFLTIRDDAAVRADVFVVPETTLYSFDLPHFKFLNKFLKSSDVAVNKQIYNGFKTLNGTIDMLNLWMQVAYSPDNFGDLDASAYNMFMGLLPGMQVTPLDALNYSEAKTEQIKKLEELRESPVFQHGSFDYLTSHNETAFAYTRVKSGNPGYFVALNPSNVDIKANFTSSIVGSEMSVLLLSDGFKDNQLKGKVMTGSVPLSKHSVAIFTFVPK